MQPHTVEVIAHRGACAAAPEHTLAAYDLALAQGADALEVDVRATADGELVLVHDPTLLRTAGVAVRVEHLTAAALAGIAPALRPLTLDALLARYGRRTRYLVELKDPAPAWERRVVAAIERHGLGDRAVAQSFDVAALRRLRRATPWLAVAPLLHEAPPAARLAALASFAAAVGVGHGAVDAGLVSRAHAAGLRVRAWTVNAPRDLRRLLATGVDGLITDVPGVARDVVDRAAAGSIAA